MEFLDGATLKHFIGNRPDVCVMVEQEKDGQELFRFDPIGGRGQHITQEFLHRNSYTLTMAPVGRSVADTMWEAPS